VIPALGYEAMRLLCTTDSVIVINRPGKTYYAASFDHYRRKYNIPIDFNDLQSVLTNEVFYYKGEYADQTHEKLLDTKEHDNLFVIDSFREGRRITNQGIQIDKEGRKLENVFIIDYDTKMQLNLDYEDFSGQEEILFPKRIRLDLVESNNTIKADISYGQVIFNDTIKVEFAVPTQYTRGDI
jgi:hypothetical protein